MVIILTKVHSGNIKLCQYDEKVQTLKKINPYPCPRKSFVTVFAAGHLGNHISQYAGVWSVGRLTGLMPIVPECIRDDLDNLFENLSLPSFSQFHHCPKQQDPVVLDRAKDKSTEEWKVFNQSVVLYHFYQNFDVILPWIKELRQEFKIKKNWMKIAKNILHDAKLNVTESSQNINYEITYIGIHVRRTDYISLLKRYGVQGFVNKEYFLQAMKYFENKFPNVIFIVISDDPKWCKKNIGNHQNVYIASKINLYNTTEQDFAVMAACNHSIIDYGTFGAWGAILAGGETFVYKIPNMQPGHTGSEIAELLPNWHYL